MDNNMPRLRPPAMPDTEPAGAAPPIRRATPPTGRADIKIAGGTAGIAGALIGLISLALPWVRVEALFIEQGFSLTDLIDLGRLLEESLLTAIAGVILALALTTCCAAIVCGSASLVASGVGARAVAIALVAEGGVLAAASMMFSFYVLIPDGTAWTSAAPSFGAAAAFLGGLTMAAGGVAGIVGSLNAWAPRPAVR